MIEPAAISHYVNVTWTYNRVAEKWRYSKSERVQFSRCDFSTTEGIDNICYFPYLRA